MSRLTAIRGSITMFALIAATLLGGAIHGQLTRRWGVHADVLEVGRLLERVPVEIGRWKLQESGTLEPHVMEMLQCTGYLKGMYEHRDTGAIVHVAVLMGPSGPIAVHTPEICFSSHAHVAEGPRQAIELTSNANRTDEFWLLTFQPKTPGADYLRVYYGWTTGERWVAASHPRFTYSGHPWLYKLQLATSVSANSISDGKDPGREFLELFVPAIDGMLARTSL